MAEMTMAALIDELGKARQSLLDEVDKLRPELLGARSGEGEWDVRQIIEHMTYAERRYVTNISAIRTALALGTAAELGALLDEWRRAREPLLAELAQVSAGDLDRRIPGNDRTIREWATMAINHDRAHAAQLSTIVKQVAPNQT